jgi:hypothetical protein
MQKRSDTTGLFINTYGPTAVELANTFGKNEIEKKDYFDIAIYAHNILRKMEERPQLLGISTLEDLSTYSYLNTFFQASNRYIQSITDIEKKQQTIMSFSRQFYDYILTLIVNSLYTGYVTEEDGALFLQERFREGDVVKIGDEVIGSINVFYATVDAVMQNMQSLWDTQKDGDDTILKRIEKNMIRLKAFDDMIRPTAYKNYITTPYLAESGSTDSIRFPAIDTDTGIPIRLETSVLEKMKNSRKLANDPRIEELKKIWPDADPTAWILEGEDIRIVQAPYKIGRSGAGNSSIKISALYKNKTFADGIIYYDNYQMRVVTDKPMTIPVYKSFLLQLEVYLDFIDKEIVGLGGDEEVGEIAIFPLLQRIRIGDRLYSLDIQEGN